MASTIFENKNQTGVSWINVMFGLFYWSAFIDNAYSLTANQSNYFPCTGMTNSKGLIVVNCSKLELKDIPVGLPTDINILDLSFNQIKRAQLKSLHIFQYLKYLNLANNSINNIFGNEFADLIFLQEIDLTGNYLIGIGRNPFRNLAERLRAIRGIEAAQFHNKVFGNLEKIKELSIVFHQRIIPRDIFRPLKGLQDLHIAVTDATTLPTGLFNVDSKSILKNLKIEANSLTSLSNAILWKLSELSYFTIIAKHLMELPGNLFNSGSVQPDLGNQILSVININEITIDGVKRLPGDLFRKQIKIRKINLKGVSKIGEQLFRELTTLVYLDLSYCIIHNISDGLFSGCASLRALNLSHTKLMSIELDSFSDLSSLVTMDISNNNMKYIDGEVLRPLRHSLRILDLSRNSLESLPPNLLGGMYNMEVLDISHNKISNLPRCLLKDVGVLKQLFAQGNLITGIQDSLFATQYDLLEVDFSDNNISAIESGSFQNAVSLKKIEIDRNPLKCGCDVAEILSYENIEIIGSCQHSRSKNDAIILSNLNNLDLDEGCFTDQYIVSSDIPPVMSSTIYSTPVSDDLSSNLGTVTAASINNDNDDVDNLSSSISTVTTTSITNDNNIDDVDNLSSSISTVTTMSITNDNDIDDVDNLSSSISTVTTASISNGSVDDVNIILYNQTDKPDGSQYADQENTKHVDITMEFYIAIAIVGIITAVAVGIGVHFAFRYMREKTYYTSGYREGRGRSLYRWK